MAVSPESTTTRSAILGQLALRDWSGYELAGSMRRTLHWFWPRAESVIYAEARKLERDGLTTSRSEPAVDGSRRSRRVYSITDRGRTALASWLAQPTATVTWHIEPLLRVHLARFGRREDLLASIAQARAVAEELLGDADAVATEFVQGRHIFQDEAHLRGLLFDALVAQGRALQEWADAATAEVHGWTDLDGSAAARKRAVGRMRAHLRSRELLRGT